MSSEKLREVICTECYNGGTECYKKMQPVWKSEPPYYLAGWVCNCCNTEPAILREKKFKRDEHDK